MRARASGGATAAARASSPHRARAGRCGPRRAAAWRRRRTGARAAAARAAIASLREFLRRHRREVLLLQDLAGGERERGIESTSLLGAACACSALRRRGAAPARSASRLARGARSRSPSALDLRQQQRHHLLEQLRVAPEESNACSNSACCSCRSSITAASAAEVVSLRDRPLPPPRSPRSPAGPTGSAGAAQHAHEVEDVLGETAPARGGIAAACRSQPDASADARRRRASSPLPATSRRDVVLILEQHAERVGDRLPDRARSRRARPAPWPSRASRRCPAP